MASEYRFEVTPDVNNAIRVLNQISKLQDSIAEKGDTMLKSGGYSSSTGFQNLVSQMRLVDTLSNTAKGSLAQLQNQASSNNDSTTLTALQKQAQQLETQLKSTRSLFDDLVKSSSVGVSRGAMSSARRDYVSGDFGLNDRAIHEDIRERQRQVNNLGSRQTSRVNRAVDSGHLSYIDNQRYNRDSTEGSKMIQQQQDFIRSQRQMAQNRINTAQSHSKRATQQYAAGNINSDEFNATLAHSKTEEEAATRLIKSLNSLSQATASTANKLDRADATMSSSNTRVDARKGSWQDIMQSRSASFTNSVVGAATGNFTGRYSKGRGLNMSTMDQAFQIGDNTTNNMSSQDVRNMAITAGAKRSTGFGMSDSLAYMQMAQGANYGSNPDVSSKYLTTLMQNARSSGFGVSNYNSLMSNAIAGGAASNSKQVNSITDQINGGAQNSNTQGLLQEQVKYLSQIVKNQANTERVTTQGVKNASATQSYLEKNGGSSWKGTAGGNNLNQMNSAFQSAGTGGNSKLLRALIQSNPTKFQGQSGYLKAEIQASEGITNPNNIQDIAGSVKNYARGNVSSAALAYQNLGIASNPKAAKELAEMTEKGELTTSRIKKWEKENNSTGSNKKKNNSNSYNSSTDSSNAESTAQYEKSISNEQNAIGKYVNTMEIGINKMPPLLTSLIAATSVGFAAVLKALAVSGISSVVRGGTGGGKGTGTGSRSASENATTAEKTVSKESRLSRAANKAETLASGTTGARSKVYHGASTVLSKGDSLLKRTKTGKIAQVARKGSTLLEDSGLKGLAGIGVLTTGLDAYSTYETTKENGNIKYDQAKANGATKKKLEQIKKNNRKKTTNKTVNSVGEGAATTLGTGIGATIGSALDPFTFGLGTFAGAAVGGWVGNKLYTGAGKVQNSVERSFKKDSSKNDSKKRSQQDKDKRNLDKAAQILEQARAQNGIFGKASNTNSITANSNASSSSSSSKSSKSSANATTIAQSAAKDSPTANATGNVISKPTLSWVSEHDEETVVPTGGNAANSSRSKALAAYAASKTGISGGGSSSMNIPITVNVNGNVTDATSTGNKVATAIQNKLKNSLADYTVNWSQQS